MSSSAASVNTDVLQALLASDSDSDGVSAPRSGGGSAARSSTLNLADVLGSSDSDDELNAAMARTGSASTAASPRTANVLAALDSSDSDGDDDNAAVRAAMSSRGSSPSVAHALLDSSDEDGEGDPPLSPMSSSPHNNLSGEVNAALLSSDDEAIVKSMRRNPSVGREAVEAALKSDTESSTSPSVLALGSRGNSTASLGRKDVLTGDPEVDDVLASISSRPTTPRSPALAAALHSSDDSDTGLSPLKPAAGTASTGSLAHPLAGSSQSASTAAMEQLLQSSSSDDADLKRLLGGSGATPGSPSSPGGVGGGDGGGLGHHHLHGGDDSSELSELMTRSQTADFLATLSPVSSDVEVLSKPIPKEPPLGNDGVNASASDRPSTPPPDPDRDSPPTVPPPSALPPPPADVAAVSTKPPEVPPPIVAPPSISDLPPPPKPDAELSLAVPSTDPAVDPAPATRVETATVFPSMLVYVARVTGVLSKSDVYVKATISGETQETAVDKGAKDEAVFDTSAPLAFSKIPSSASVDLTVLDKDRFTADDVIGHAVVPLASLMGDGDDTVAIKTDTSVTVHLLASTEPRKVMPAKAADAAPPAPPAVVVAEPTTPPLPTEHAPKPPLDPVPSAADLVMAAALASTSDSDDLLDGLKPVPAPTPAAETPVATAPKPTTPPEPVAPPPSKPDLTRGASTMSMGDLPILTVMSPEIRGLRSEVVSYIEVSIGSQSFKSPPTPAPTATPQWKDAVARFASVHWDDEVGIKLWSVGTGAGGADELLGDASPVLSDLTTGAPVDKMIDLGNGLAFRLIMMGSDFDDASTTSSSSSSSSKLGVAAASTTEPKPDGNQASAVAAMMDLLGSSDSDSADGDSSDHGGRSAAFTDVDTTHIADDSDSDDDINALLGGGDPFDASGPAAAAAPAAATTTATTAAAPAANAPAATPADQETLVAAEVVKGLATTPLVDELEDTDYVAPVVEAGGDAAPEPRNPAPQPTPTRESSHSQQSIHDLLLSSDDEDDILAANGGGSIRSGSGVGAGSGASVPPNLDEIFGSESGDEALMAALSRSSRGGSGGGGGGSSVHSHASEGARLRAEMLLSSESSEARAATQVEPSGRVAAGDDHDALGIFDDDGDHEDLGIMDDDDHLALGIMSDDGDDHAALGILSDDESDDLDKHHNNHGGGGGGGGGGGVGLGAATDDEVLKGVLLSEASHPTSSFADVLEEADVHTRRHAPHLRGQTPGVDEFSAGDYVLSDSDGAGLSPAEQARRGRHADAVRHDGGLDVGLAGILDTPPVGEGELRSHARPRLGFENERRRIRAGSVTESVVSTLSDTSFVSRSSAATDVERARRKQAAKKKKKRMVKRSLLRAASEALSHVRLADGSPLTLETLAAATGQSSDDLGLLRLKDVLAVSAERAGDRAVVEVQPNPHAREILAAIQACSDDKGTVLSLGDLEMRDVPHPATRLIHLKKLFLHNNLLVRLPRNLVRLKYLRYLSAANNKLKKLPSEMGRLVSLQELYLGGNQLEALPASFADLGALRWLDLSRNHFSVFPPEVCALADLWTLDLSHNQLAAVPDDVAQLANLRGLYLIHNQLSSLPPTLAYLIALKTLSVEGNQLTDLPSGLEALADLVRLTLDDNPIDLGSDRMLRLQRLISNRALEAA